jgi:hypothetical protein
MSRAAVSGGRSPRGAGGREPWVDEPLARRALVHLPVRRLRAVSDDPIGDIREGRHEALAAAELEWFGVTASRPDRR